MLQRTVMLALPSANKPITDLSAKTKERRRSSTGRTTRVISRQPSTFANDKSRKASFQKSDNVDGNDILSYLEDNPATQELRCEQVLGLEEHLGPIHRLLVQYHANIHIHSLELPKNGLTGNAGDDLAKILQSQQQTLFKLDLSGNPLGVAGCLPILDQLIIDSSPSRLQILNLSETRLGSKGVTTIATMLRYNKSIQELHLGHNKLGPKGITTLVTGLATNSTLQVLDVSYNQIKSQGATTLAEFLQTCKESSLRVIDITCNNIGDAGIHKLAVLLSFDRRIEGLYAGGNQLGESGASRLANALRMNYTLKELRLEANELGDNGVRLLVKSLGENEHRSSAVEKINLGWNGIGLEGATSLADALKENSMLGHIDLTGNTICCAGAKALAESLSYNLTLNELILAQNNIQDQGAFALALAMGKPSCHLQKLQCSDNPISSKGQASLERVPVLRMNQKYWLTQLMHELSKGIIHGINLTERNIGDEELCLLTDVLESSSPSLNCFWLSGAGLSSRSLLPFFGRALGPTSRIVRLYVKDCNCGDEIAQCLSSVLCQNTHLEILSLTNSSLSARGASAIAEGLSKNTKLRRLNLDRNHIGDVGMAGLDQIIPQTSLISLSVSNNSLTDQSMDLECTMHLKELSMNGNQITDLGAVMLCRHLMNDCQLVWLSLQNNRLTSKGGDVIQTVLPDTTTFDY